MPKKSKPKILVGASPAVLLAVAIALGAHLPANPNIPCSDGEKRILVVLPEAKITAFMSSPVRAQCELWVQKSGEPALKVS